MAFQKTLKIKSNGFFKNHPMTNEPASPTCSVFSSFSWMAEKSSSEVKHILKSAFSSLAEKERDLKLAAEVGKTLLENNTLLEQKYHTLQNEFDLQNQRSTKQYQHRLQRNEDVITSLETQNAELLKKYEATLESKEKISRQNTSSQQKLTCQVNELYRSLELAYEKIQEHEDYRQDYMKKMNGRDNDIFEASRSVIPAMTNNHHYDYIEELSNKMEHMSNQNQELLKAKEHIEYQVKDAMTQLNGLQQQFSQVQQSKEQFNLLEHKFQHQENHIHQLTSLIEEYRLNLLSDCHHETMPSLITESHFSSDDDEEYYHDRFDALPQQIKGNSLFSELQSAFNNNNKNEFDHHQHRHSRSLERDSMMLITADYETSTKKTRSRKGSNNEKVLCVYPDLKVDDSLIAPMKVYHKKVARETRNDQKSKGLVYHVAQIPLNSFHLIWRFIRFFIVIQLAMVIHLLTSKK